MIKDIYYAHKLMHHPNSSWWILRYVLEPVVKANFRFTSLTDCDVCFENPLIFTGIHSFIHQHSVSCITSCHATKRRTAPTSCFTLANMFFSSDMPLFIIAKEFQKAFLDSVLHTEDVDFCTIVTGKVSYWWLNHANHVCPNCTVEQLITTSVSAQSSCRSLLSSGDYTLPFCPAYWQLYPLAFLVFQSNFLIRFRTVEIVSLIFFSFVGTH